MSRIEVRLRALRDVEDVYGSFVVATQGVLVARDLSQLFSNELLAEVATRVALLGEASSLGEEPLLECSLRYAEHRLHLRGMSWGVLGVLTGTGVNAAALRMAMNLVLRHIDAEAAPASARGAAAPGSPFDAAGPTSQQTGPSSGSGPRSARSGPISEHPPVLAQDGRDSTVPHGSQHPRLYRGRPVSDD